MITPRWSTGHANASTERSFRFSRLFVAFMVFPAHSIQLGMNDAPWIVTLRTTPKVPWKISLSKALISAFLGNHMTPCRPWVAKLSAICLSIKTGRLRADVLFAIIMTLVQFSSFSYSSDFMPLLLPSAIMMLVLSMYIHDINIHVYYSKLFEIFEYIKYSTLILWIILKTMVTFWSKDKIWLLVVGVTNDKLCNIVYDINLTLKLLLISVSNLYFSDDDLVRFKNLNNIHLNPNGY